MGTEIPTINVPSYNSSRNPHQREQRTYLPEVPILSEAHSIPPARNIYPLTHVHPRAT